MGNVVDEIARAAANSLKWTLAGACRGKAYDDVIDAGLAFLTASCSSVGSARWIGDGADGAILVPIARAHR